MKLTKSRRTPNFYSYVPCVRVNTNTNTKLKESHKNSSAYPSHLSTVVPLPVASPGTNWNMSVHPFALYVPSVFFEKHDF